MLAVRPTKCGGWQVYHDNKRKGKPHRTRATAQRAMHDLLCARLDARPCRDEPFDIFGDAVEAHIEESLWT